MFIPQKAMQKGGRFGPAMEIGYYAPFPQTYWSLRGTKKWRGKSDSSLQGSNWHKQYLHGASPLASLALTAPQESSTVFHTQLPFPCFLRTIIMHSNHIPVTLCWPWHVTDMSSLPINWYVAVTSISCIIWNNWHKSRCSPSHCHCTAT